VVVNGIEVVLPGDPVEVGVRCLAVFDVLASETSTPERTLDIEPSLHASAPIELEPVAVPA